MDFNKLLSTLDSLNKTKLAESVDTEVSECGGDTTPHAPPTMSVSLNANGLDDISSLMRLLVKVNPDMMPKDDKGPTLSADPNILTITNNHPEPLKMLPEPTELDGEEDGDMDNDEDEGIAGTIAGGIAGLAATKSLAGASTGASIGSDIQDAVFGDKETEEDISAGFNDAHTSPRTKTYDTKELIGRSNGIDKEKEMVKHSYKQGDNPMAMKDRDFKESIRLDLQQRLAEIKSR
jgi:hypothetical protein